ncbi:MAG: hypothetical protein H8D69_01495 [Chloroflexi bacterium]|nr:hypothetical protein [Chloroflexota bacterium]
MYSILTNATIDVETHYWRTSLKPRNENAQKSSRARFLLGAAIGVAISVPLFAGIDEAPVQFALMAAFAVIMGYAQVLAGRDTPGARKFTKWAIVGGIVALFAGIVAFMFAA